MIKILSIDGGGIRGIIPAVILAEIERRTGKPVAELFDLVAGTSTGGILALGLTIPDKTGIPRYSADAMTGLYAEQGLRIFSRSAWHKAKTLSGLSGPKYSAVGIEAVLEEFFGEMPLGNTLADVLVTGYGLERRRPVFFKSRKAKLDPRHNFLMREVARATSAAPTYFPPAKVSSYQHAPYSEDYIAAVDGGTYANNPTMCGYVEAKKLHPKATDFLVVSLGTGELNEPISYAKAKGWGLGGWAVPVLGVVFDGVCDATDHQMSQLLPPNRYHRLQTTLIGANEAMDDASPENIRNLRLLAENLVFNNELALSSLCDQL